MEYCRCCGKGGQCCPKCHCCSCCCHCVPCCCSCNPEPNPPEPFSFQKVDQETGEPLGGAVFTLSNGAAAVSAGDGEVNFGTLEPGVYTMTETASPEGYEENQEAYVVEVKEDGSIMVDNVPLSDFAAGNVRRRSPRPVIYSVEEGDSFVSGQGVPGAEIEVLLPDGTSVSTTVNANGVWVVPVPGQYVLKPGQTIYAVQTVPGEGESEAASFVVQPRV